MSKSALSLSKILSSVVAIVAVVWIPFVLLFISPGWGTLILFSPFAMFCLLPVFILAANHVYRTRSIPTIALWLQIAFFLAWFGIGLFYVNGGDTPESVGSAFTRLLGDRPGLIDESQRFMVVCIFLSLALLGMVVVHAVRQSTKAK